MEKIRFGIIGLGNQGSSYMFNIFDAGLVENGVVTAVCAPCLFNLYAEYIMRNARLDQAQAGIKIAGRNINNLR